MRDSIAISSFSRASGAEMFSMAAASFSFFATFANPGAFDSSMSAMMRRLTACSASSSRNPTFCTASTAAFIAAAETPCAVARAFVEASTCASCAAILAASTVHSFAKSIAL